MVSSSDGHCALFNELFSKYSVVMANAILSIDAEHDLKSNLEKEISEALKYFTSEEQEQIKEKLYEDIIDSELVDNKGKVRFCTPPMDYLYDFLPLTEIEVRWLLTVLDDSLARVFFTSEEINHIKNCMSCAPFEVGKLKLDAINYYDRYNSENRIFDGKRCIAQNSCVTEEELLFIQKIYKAIKQEYEVHIVYKNWEGKSERQPVHRCV